MACVSKQGGQSSINQVEEGWNSVTYKKKTRSGSSQSGHYKKQTKSGSSQNYKKQTKSGSSQNGREYGKISVFIPEKKSFRFSIGLSNYFFEMGFGSREGFVRIREENKEKRKYSSIWVTLECLNCLKNTMVQASSCTSPFWGGWRYIPPDTERFIVELMKYGRDEFVKVSGINNTVISFPPTGWKNLINILGDVLKESADSGLYNSNLVESKYDDGRDDVTSAIKSEECYEGDDVTSAAVKSEEFDGGEDDSLAVKSEEFDGGKDDSLAVKSEECDKDKALSELRHQSFRSICPFGETDIESSDGEEDDDESKVVGKANDAVTEVCDVSTWRATFKEAFKEVEQFFKEQREQQKEEEKGEQQKKKKEEEEEKKMMEKLTTRQLHSYVNRNRELTVYKVYIDAYFKRNRKPRFAFLVKDPSDTYQIGFVGESQSKHVPQLQTHLEGMLQGVEYVRALIGETPPPGLRIYIYTNNSYAVDFVTPPGRRPLKDEHFTADVRDMLKKLIVYTHKCTLIFTKITHFDNSAADYLARSSTSELRKVIKKKDFDEGLKRIIELLEHHEAQKLRCCEALNAAAIAANAAEVK